MSDKRTVPVGRLALQHAVIGGVAWPFILGILFGVTVIALFEADVLLSLPMMIVSYAFGIASVAFGAWYSHGFLAKRYVIERPLFLVNRSTIVLAGIFVLSSALSFFLETEGAPPILYEIAANIVMLGVFYGVSRAVFANR